MSGKLKGRLQFKVIKSFVTWAENKVVDKSVEDVIKFGHWLGRWAMRIPFKGKGDLIDVMKKVMPGRDDYQELRDKILLDQTGRLLPDALLAFKHRSSEEFPFKLEYDNIEVVEKRVQEGQGVILCTGHFGNWEMFLQAMTWKGFPMSVVQRMHHNPLINQFITDLRQSNGAQMIDFHRRQPQSFMNLVRAAKAGRVLGLLVDVVPKTGSTEVNFMGKKFEAPVGPAMLSHMTQAPVMCGYNIRTDKGYKIIVSDEIKWPNGKSSKDDVPEMTQRIMTNIEEMILKHPDHWVWYLRRYREMPFIV